MCVYFKGQEGHSKPSGSPERRGVPPSPQDALPTPLFFSPAHFPPSCKAQSPSHWFHSCSKVRMRVRAAPPPPKKKEERKGKKRRHACIYRTHQKEQRRVGSQFKPKPLSIQPTPEPSSTCSIQSCQEPHPCIDATSRIINAATFSYQRSAH